MPKGVIGTGWCHTACVGVNQVVNRGSDCHSDRNVKFSLFYFFSSRYSAWKWMSHEDIIGAGWCPTGHDFNNCFVEVMV